jgi:hypothetical protein
MPTPSLQNSDGRESRICIRTRSTESSTATSAAADEALAYVLDRKLRKREGRLPPPRRQPIGSDSNRDARAYSPVTPVRWLMPCVAAALAAAALAVTAAAVTSAARSSHSISGVLLLGGKPLPSTTVSFVPASRLAPQQTLALTTDPMGRFQTAQDNPLESGLYSVVIDTVAAVDQTAHANIIPTIYRDASTTPLRVVVTEDLSGLRLAIRR